MTFQTCAITVQVIQLFLKKSVMFNLRSVIMVMKEFFPIADTISLKVNGSQ